MTRIAHRRVVVLVLLVGACGAAYLRQSFTCPHRPTSSGSSCGAASAEKARAEAAIALCAGRPGAFPVVTPLTKCPSPGRSPGRH